MKLMERLREFWDYFGRFAEAMYDDPVEELRGRVERLERRVAQDAATAKPRENAGVKNVSRD